MSRDLFNTLELPPGSPYDRQWQTIRDLFRVLFEEVFGEDISSAGSAQQVTATSTILPASVRAIEAQVEVEMTSQPTIMDGAENQEMIVVNTGSERIGFKHGSAYNLQLIGGYDLQLPGKSAWFFVFRGGDWIQVR